MKAAIIDRITIARKRAEASSFELRAKRLREEADAIERNLLARPDVVKRIFVLEY